jgi:hypothetical protein
MFTLALIDLLVLMVLTLSTGFFLGLRSSARS